MPRNHTLNQAKAAKKDEFYTQLYDIEQELKHYVPHFKGKTVLCNCDDPYESNFFKYFALNFNRLGLKKLISTCYDGSSIAFAPGSIFVNLKPESEKRAYVAVLENVYDANGDGAVDLRDVDIILKKTGYPRVLKGDGDFRSEECVEFLKEADIVVTNPPFSLFREYMGVLIKYDKKFLIIGHINAVTYKEVYPLIQSSRVWLGISITSGDRKFNVPDDYPLDAAGCGIDGDGRKFIKVKGVRWFTNLEHTKKHEFLDLYERYSAEKYPRLDNYNAIAVEEYGKIPMDYDGAMAVPYTSIDKYCTDQFDILGLTENDATAEVNALRIPGQKKYDRPYLKGQRKFPRLIIRKKPTL